MKKLFIGSENGSDKCFSNIRVNPILFDTETDEFLKSFLNFRVNPKYNFSSHLLGSSS